MPKWEYARLQYQHYAELGSEDISMTFSNGSEWGPTELDDFWKIVRRLGDEGWELASHTGENWYQQQL